MLEEEGMVPCSTSAPNNPWSDRCTDALQPKSAAGQIPGSSCEVVADYRQRVLPSVLQCPGGHSSHDISSSLSLQLGKGELGKLSVIGDQAARGVDECGKVLVVVIVHCGVVDVWLQRVVCIRQKWQFTDSGLWTILQQQYPCRIDQCVPR